MSNTPFNPDPICAYKERACPYWDGCECVAMTPDICPYNTRGDCQSIVDWQARQACSGGYQSVSRDILEALSWMIADMNYRREQGVTGLDPAPQSPEMKKAMGLLEGLKAGKIVCWRTES